MADDHRHDDVDDRLAHLEARIEALEAQLAAEQGGPGPHYYQSGDRPELDDQAIAP